MVKEMGKLKKRILFKSFVIGKVRNIVKLAKGGTLSRGFKGYKIAAVVGIVVLALGAFSFYKPARTLADSAYTWVQSSWIGGADTVNFPSHPGNKTGWSKYFSKDSTISDTSGITLSSPSTAITDSTNGAFSAGSQSNTSAPSGQNNEILLKPVGATATNSWECVFNYISGGVCGGQWIAGRSGSALAGKFVYYQDVSGTRQWKSENTSCIGPQCTTAADGAQETYSGYTGYINHLAADNSVTFGSTYPAREACKAIGGRLPTIAELKEMYGYKSNYGNNFQSYNYWSATEYYSNLAWIVYMYNGGAYGNDKIYSYYVRCVR